MIEDKVLSKNGSSSIMMNIIAPHSYLPLNVYF